MKPLLVGEMNPYGHSPEFALYPWPPNSAGGRMCRLVLALDPADYVLGLHRANLCVGRWSLPAARKRAGQLLAEHPDGPVVLLGSKVCAAFDVPFDPPGVRERFAVLPHPSGLCRMWNEPDAFERARSVLCIAGVLPLRPEWVDRGGEAAQHRLKLLKRISQQ